MEDKKNKKKTLTISTNITKKIDISSLSRDGKKSFSIDKKKSYRPPRDNKSSSNTGNFSKPSSSKQNIVRKFVEQQATKNFIKKKEEKVSNKTKLKLGPQSARRDFKLTVSER